MPLFRFSRRRAAVRPSRILSTLGSVTPTTTAAEATAHRGAPAAARLPEAIPCYNYYDIYPEDAGPMGNLVIDSAEDMEVWKLVATPVTAEPSMPFPAAAGTVSSTAAAVQEGGLIEYHAAESGSPVMYYTFSHDADVVYGRASYQPSLPGSPATNGYVATQDFPTGKHVDPTSPPTSSAHRMAAARKLKSGG
ncbi:hypothetical protein NESM_000213000 [Novymonas esmeraldas]|uniref:Uncharacterized protein n=1 Tax=Novymonas esmeraldas TaxID=1808958 RepID=A0AAW0F5Q2_9TRYP